ncbi:MAG: hypothetical protein U1E53_07120 [Dongiaceae bacterium]
MDTTAQAAGSIGRRDIRIARPGAPQGGAGQRGLIQIILSIPVDVYQS